MITIIFGQTAVGKTQLALELAKKIDAEIISADSMQVYRGMDIGTAKPSKKEQQGIPHHLIDIKDPNEEWTVSDFVQETQKLQAKIQKKGKVPIIVGGTGLYLWSLINGYTFPKVPADKKIREKLEARPLTDLHALLSTIDPISAAKIHPNDKKRIVRALEVYEITGKSLSSNLAKEPRRRACRQAGSVSGSEHKLIGLKLPREILYERINERVDQMIKHGLVKEVEGLLKQGYSKELPAFQALGYKEVIAYLNGHWTLDKMTEELKKRTRHFARRQTTWFKRFESVKWFSQPVDIASIIDYINN